MIHEMLMRNAAGLLVFFIFFKPGHNVRTQMILSKAAQRKQKRERERDAVKPQAAQLESE